LGTVKIRIGSEVLCDTGQLPCPVYGVSGEVSTMDEVRLKEVRTQLKVARTALSEDRKTVKARLRRMHMRPVSLVCVGSTASQWPIQHQSTQVKAFQQFF
jgi:hypothetical protein